VNKIITSPFFPRYFITYANEKIVIEQTRITAFIYSNILEYNARRLVYTVRVDPKKTYIPVYREAGISLSLENRGNLLQNFVAF